MIISHKYKFIFLKTRKTGGTSIEIALSKFCGDKDIITPIFPEDEMIRKELGYRGPQNYFISYARYSFKDLKNRVLHGEKKKFYNHIPACKVLKCVGIKVWNSYYKFCFERNPWDKSISRYYWDTEKYKLNQPYEEYILTLSKKFISCYEIYTINGQIAVDKVGLYENLNEEIDMIGQKIGLPEKLVLPRAKGAYRKDKRPYQDLIVDREREYVRNICKNEIQLFGYKF
ncbi:MAG: chondroitin 4-O-sulfotransferase [Candidatus Kuenenia stuttgartiensis]|nr:chondroitin 4-O-sulfotransferase [Candidatus Kuenenia stuttgartiensis]